MCNVKRRILLIFKIAYAREVRYVNFTQRISR